MNRWKMLVAVGLIVFVLGFAFVTTASDTQYSIRETRANENQRNPQATQFNEPVVSYENMTQLEREEVDKMLNGTRLNKTPGVVNRTNSTGAEVSVNGTSYTVYKEVTTSETVLHKLGVGGIIGGLLLALYGFKYRDIEELSEEITELRHELNEP